MKVDKVVLVFRSPLSLLLIRASGRVTDRESFSFSSRLICRIVCGTVPPAETFNIHHSLQIPADCYPSLQIQGNPIKV